MRDPTQVLEGTVRAQREIIAAILVNNDLYDRLGLMRPHFTDPVCQRVFALASELIEKGERADEITVSSYLTEQQRHCIADLIEMRGDADALTAYAALLRTDFQRRGLAALGTDMTAASQDSAIAPDRLIEGYQDRLDELRGVTAHRQDSSIGASISRVVSGAATAFETGVPPGLQTGIRVLDEKLHPMRGGQLIVAGGANGHGKSVLGTTVLLNNAFKGVPSLLFSLEMKGDDFAQRLLAGQTGIAAGNIIGGKLSEEDFRLLQEIERASKNWPIAVETPQRLTSALLVRIARQQIRKRHIQIVVVDHIGLMHGRGKSSYEQMSDITRSLKEAALELDIPILALAQLNRDPQRRGDAKDWNDRYLRRRPKKSDLRDSGSIEQDADVVLLLHREEEYAVNEEPPISDSDHSNWSAHMERHRGRIDVAIAKQRQGQQALIHCAFDGARFRIQ